MLRREIFVAIPKVSGIPVIDVNVLNHMGAKRTNQIQTGRRNWAQKDRIRDISLEKISELAKFNLIIYRPAKHDFNVINRSHITLKVISLNCNFKKRVKWITLFDLVVQFISSTVDPLRQTPLARESCISVHRLKP